MPPTSESRHFVTVVISDLKGSTALGEKLDPESLREVVGRYFDEMRLVLESHGGTIEKYIGDAIIAVFGLPTPADDDALRAVEAAAESMAVLANLNEQLERRWGVRLVNRTGVCSGEVVVGEEQAGQHVLTGPAVTIAGIMEQNAPPLEALLDVSTYGLVREHVSAEPFGRVKPKKGDGSYVAFRLVSVRSRGPVAVGPGADDPATRRPTFRESRKTVTLVFADPKPAPLDGRAPTPEALRDAMSRYFEAMRVALERHGATVEKFIGDAVMAVFGLPVRHEDDAIRAIRAAAEMQAALPALNEDLRGRWRLEIRNHIGVNTGEVIAGDASLGQRLVTGDAVNTAARLEQAAGAGEIIIGELTHRLARDQIDVVAIEPLALKGKAEPVPAYRLVEVRERPAKSAAGDTPFVGRELEMTRLAEALRETRTGRRAGLVTVVGDAGVGKSRLIREFAAHAGDAANVVRGRCLPYGDGITFWPIAEIVREAAGIGTGDRPTVAVGKVRRLIEQTSAERDDRERDAIADRVAVAMGLATGQYPVTELFWGIRRLVERLAAERPLVAIVDDIHSAEATFLELIDHLLDAVDAAPLLLLCSARHELLDKHADWSTAHADARITLSPLAPGEAGRMIEQLLGEAGLDETISRRIVDAAEGNPLFVEQMVSMLVDDGLLRRDGERWVAVDAGATIVVPPTIHALLAARLDNLAGEERGVVEPASVVGLFFPQDAVAELVEDEARPTVPTHLAELSRKQFVRPESPDGEPAFRFGHQLIRDTAYGSLLKRERVGLHERFVTWAERVNRERGRETEFEEILGYHLEQAYRYRDELGPIDDEARAVGERAAAKLASAGRRAHARGDSPAAANLLGRASAVLPRAARFRLELISDLGEALIALGRFEDATGVLDEGAAVAADLGDDHLVARMAVIRLYAEVFGSGETSMTSAIEKAEQAIASLEGTGDDASLARAWRMIMLCQATVGRLEDASLAASRVVEHATSAGDPVLASRSASAIAYVLVHGPTPVPLAIERCRELLESIAGDRKNEAYVFGALAQLLAMNGEFAEARAAYRRVQATLQDLGADLEASTTSIESSRVELLAGDLAAAEAELKRDDVALAAFGERYFRSTVVAILANVHAARGDYDAASSRSTLAEQLADDDDVWSQVAWRTARAKVLAAAGDAAAAVEIARAAAARAAPTEDIELRAEALVDLGDVLRSVGRADESGPPLREALGLYEQKGDQSSAARLRISIAALTAT